MTTQHVTLPTDSPAPADPPAPSPGQPRGRTVAVIGGIGVALAAAGVGYGLSQVNGLLSPMLVAILLGIVAGNASQRLHLDAVKPGLDIAGKRLLRVGIVLLGLQLSLSTIAGLGVGVVALAALVVSLGVPFGIWCGRRLGLTQGQSVLTACGFSICGAAAVAAADGVVDADEDEVATSVGLVVVFGTLMIPLSVLVGSLGLGDHATGVFAGAAIHEVAQVVAAGGLVGGGALAVAVVVKLARVLMLAPLMTVLAVRRRRELAAAAGSAESGVAESDSAKPGSRESETDPKADVKLPPIMPLFVAGFIVAVLVRSFVPVPGVVLDGAKIMQTVLLAAAMFALGTGVRWATMKRVGARPFVHAACCTGFVTALALVGAFVLG